MKLDGKFHGIIVKNKNGSIVPQDQWIVFLAKDNALPATLEFYEGECRRLGAEEPQIAAVGELRRRVAAWRNENSHLCKVADVEQGELK